MENSPNREKHEIRDESKYMYACRAVLPFSPGSRSVPELIEENFLVINGSEDVPGQESSRRNLYFLRISDLWASSSSREIFQIMEKMEDDDTNTRLTRDARRGGVNPFATAIEDHVRGRQCARAARLSPRESL